ncbi:MAG TPA: DUF1361 domain-containing protein, partial [Blastocatellia bacterium]|nr:DUF1361 domain-containing protein [Blastocatellia bacterium]
SLCISILGVRMVYTGSYRYIFLVWNLFLAWLPVVGALTSYNLSNRTSKRVWLPVCLCACLWLLFLPNAPYLITDLVHLKARNDFLYWFDLVMFISFAWTGIFLGLVSLYLMQEVVKKVASVWASWVFVVIVIGLSSFGIYLGRFPRWNSWDIATQPTILMADIWERVTHPVAHLQTFAFSGLFSLFLLTTYLMLLAATYLRNERE